MAPASYLNEVARLCETQPEISQLLRSGEAGPPFTADQVENKMPTLDEFLQPLAEQLDPDAAVEKEYLLSRDKLFTWKALRLLRRHRFKLMYDTMRRTDIDPVVVHLEKEKKGTATASEEPKGETEDGNEKDDQGDVNVAQEDQDGDNLNDADADADADADMKVAATDTEGDTEKVPADTEADPFTDADQNGEGAATLGRDEALALDESNADADSGVDGASGNSQSEREARKRKRDLIDDDLNEPDTLQPAANEEGEPNGGVDAAAEQTVHI